MNGLKHHLVHHRWHMLGCVAGAVIAVVGGLTSSEAMSIAGAVICSGFCFEMIRTMVVVKPKRG
jgi:hypothetical protein